MSAIRKTKRKFQPPRSSFTFVRQSKNNPKLNESHNQPDDIYNDNLEEDNLQNYFDEDNESDNNQQQDMIIEDSFQEYSNDDQEYSNNDQAYSTDYFNNHEDSDQEYIGDDQDEDQYGSDDQDEDQYDQDDSDQEYIGDDQYGSDDQDEDQYNQDDQDEDQDNQNEDNFKSITSLMMFTWITKHMIGNSAYKDLVNIINNENFNPTDVPKNVQTLKKQRKCLPLHKINENIVNINKEKTSSNSQPTKMAYSISIIDHIHEILNNSQIAPRLYFGPGIETDKKSEFWHGTIWQESPLFGITSIIINKSNFYLFIIKLNYYKYYN